MHSSEDLHPNIARASQAWNAKPGLRRVYGDMYAEILKRSDPDANILEIGAGSGHSRAFLTDRRVIRLDISTAPWLDLVADAHAIPIADASVDRIALIDVLHHLADPPAFFREVSRVLSPGGKIIMVEPGITPMSGLLYRGFHEEPVMMQVDPLTCQNYADDKDPFDSNQAIPTLIFKRTGHRSKFETLFPELQIEEVRWKSLFAYPLSGGFQPWSLLSEPLAGVLLQLEKPLERVLGPLAAFRLLVVLKKVAIQTG